MKLTWHDKQNRDDAKVVKIIDAASKPLKKLRESPFIETRDIPTIEFCLQIESSIVKHGPY